MLPWQKGLKSSNTRANSREDVLLSSGQRVVMRVLRHCLASVNLLSKNERKKKRKAIFNYYKAHNAQSSVTVDVK